MRRSLVALTLGLALACASPSRADGPKPGEPPHPAKPQPTEAERTEIRDLVGRLGGGRGRGNPNQRSAAAAALAGYGLKAEAAIPALINATKDREETVASSAAVALGQVAGDSHPAVEALVKLLEGGRTPSLKVAAAQGLAFMGPGAVPALAPLLEALGGTDGDLRREAAAAIGQLGPTAAARATAPLEARLTDQEPRVRVVAATSMARLGAASLAAITVLAGAVPKSGNMQIELRRDACEGLGLAGPAAASAVPALISVLREVPEVNPAIPFAAQRKELHDAFRRAAASALGRIGSKDAIPALTTAADVPELHDAATDALAKLQGS